MRPLWRIKLCNNYIMKSSVKINLKRSWLQMIDLKSCFAFSIIFLSSHGYVMCIVAYNMTLVRVPFHINDAFLFLFAWCLFFKRFSLEKNNVVAFAIISMIIDFSSSSFFFARLLQCDSSNNFVIRTKRKKNNNNNVLTCVVYLMEIVCFYHASNYLHIIL